MSGEWQRMKRRVVRGRGHLLGLRRASSAEHHRRHTLGPHGDRADVGRKHEGLAPAEVIGVARLRVAASHSKLPRTRLPRLSPHPTALHVCRALGCDAAVEGGAAAENARKGRRRGVAYEATRATQTRRYSISEVLVSLGRNPDPNNCVRFEGRKRANLGAFTRASLSLENRVRNHARD